METGTLNHAALAGVAAAVDFIASLGSGTSLREQLLDGMAQISQHERQLLHQLFSGLRQIKRLQIIGTGVEDEQRAPTLSFVVEHLSATEICQALADEAICAWAGHFYALRSVEVLGLLSRGGVTRLGLSAYNTAAEINRVLETLRRIVEPVSLSTS
ncbi:MAG: aminotransferase class V-fold PLP-dependent enzyme, partial [Bacteroidota bacterium]